MTEVLLEFVRDYGTPAIFLLVMLENLGLLWVTAPGYVVAAEIVRSGRMDFWVMVAVISGGHMLGATIAWSVTRAGENRLSRFLCRNERIEKAYSWLNRWYDRHGAVTLLAGRFIGQIRPWTSLAAGMATVPPLPFLFWTALGTVGYSIWILWVFLSGLRLWLNIPELRWPIMVLAGIALLGFAIYLGIRRLRDKDEGTGRDESD